MSRRHGMPRRPYFFKIWLLVGMAQSDVERSVPEVYKKSCSCVASTWYRWCAIPSPDPNPLPMSTGGSMQRWSRFSMCRWLRGSTLCSLQFRVLQTTENLQTMSFQEMDYRTVVHRCCRLSGNCGRHSVVNFQRKCQEGPREIFDRQVLF